MTQRLGLLHYGSMLVIEKTPILIILIHLIDHGEFI